MDLSNFFSAAEAGMERWSQLNTTARSWESAVKGSGTAGGLKLIKPSVLERTKLAAGRIY
jgi:hypothetical protein